MGNIGKNILCVSTGMHETEIKFELFESDSIFISTGHKNPDNDLYPRIYTQVRMSDLKNIISFLDAFKVKQQLKFIKK